MRNKEVAGIFRDTGEILKIRGENPFRIRAYFKAARNIESLGQDVSEIAAQDKLAEIPGVGRDLAEKIKEILTTGKLGLLEGLQQDVPPGMTLLMTIPGIGPKTAALLYEKLKIKDIGELEQAALNHQISGLPGIKERTEENILRGIALRKKADERMLLSIAGAAADELVRALKQLKEVEQIEAAGSLRRGKETVRDIDILIASGHSAEIMRYFTGLEQVREVQACGPTKSSIITKEGIQVDVRVIEPESFGAALVYFTGSKEFNIKLRHLAQTRGMKINEYGVFKEDKRLAGETEAGIFRLLEFPYIVPELREDRGEIEAALAGKLPAFMELKDIKGDLHVHSQWSDGASSIEDIAARAKEKGYQYIAVTDHSQAIKIARGLSVDRLKEQIDSIRRLNKKWTGLQILAGSEVDIRSDGKLDYPDAVLKELDVVVAAIHTGFKQSEKQLTERMMAAMENRYVNIIAHPSGRLIGEREAYPLDMERILEKARETGTIMEINAFPQRLDLTDINCHRAKELGVKTAISTDAHILPQLDYMQLGVTTARRGWLEKKDAVNTLPLSDLLDIFHQKRQK